MQQIRYIHAADLHLDAPFLGINKELGGSLSHHLHKATFTALERLLRLCEEVRPDFLVLAGDIYNEEDNSIKAQLAISDLCRKLHSMGVRVFLVHGNHDPLNSRFNSINWPDNVTIFGTDMQVARVERDGETIALVHGISHAQGKEARNLARLFKRSADENCFQLGLLHCAVEGQAGDRYAPCTVQDLVDSGLDAFALGHVHTRAVLSEQPFIAYPGNTQGLHINEGGERGCFVVTVTGQQGSFSCNADFRPLGPIVFATHKVSIDGMEHVDVLDEQLFTELGAIRSDAWPGCQAMIVRVVLHGATVLDKHLRSAAGQADLLERLSSLRNANPGIWIKDLKVETTPPIDWEEYRKRDDLLGSALRMVQQLRENPDRLQEFSEPLLQQLYGHSRLRQDLQRPDSREILSLLDDVERLCVEKLEDENVR